MRNQAEKFMIYMKKVLLFSKYFSRTWTIFISLWSEVGKYSEAFFAKYEPSFCNELTSFYHQNSCASISR